MIIREILKYPELLESPGKFDYFNDSKDTIIWLHGRIQELPETEKETAKTILSKLEQCTQAYMDNYFSRKSSV